MGSWLTYGLGSDIARICPVTWCCPQAAAPAAGRRCGRAAFCRRRIRACCSATRASRCSICRTRRDCQPTSCSARRSTRWQTSIACALQATGDPEIASRIASYELAFRMQSAAPELIDLSGETHETLDAVRRRPRRWSHAKACSARRAGAVQRLRHELPARAPAGRARCAIRQPVSRVVGPSRRPRKVAASTTPAWSTSRWPRCSRI